MIKGTPMLSAICAAIILVNTEAHPFAVHAYARCTGLCKRYCIPIGNGKPIITPHGKSRIKARMYCMMPGSLRILYVKISRTKSVRIRTIIRIIRAFRRPWTPTRCE